MAPISGPRVLDALSQETRTLPPPAAFAARANVRDRSIYERAARDLEGYWAEQARTLEWVRPFERVLEWDAPYAKWFVGGQLNVSTNCLDRHVRAGRAMRRASTRGGHPAMNTVDSTTGNMGIRCAADPPAADQPR